MLKIFTLKYEERTVFNDCVMSNFLADKEILRWESQFFERKNEYFWTVLVESPGSHIADRTRQKGRKKERRKLQGTAH
jgi:hypothetical protein